MKSSLNLTKKKLVTTIVICASLIASLIVFGQMRKVVEAAILHPQPESVGWWRFDEESGSIAKDSSLFENDGVIHGAVWDTGKYGKALSFDGTDDYVEVPDDQNLRLNGNFTIEFWMRHISFKQTYPGPLHKGDSGPTGTGFIIFYLSNGQIIFKRANYYCSTPPSQVTTSWRHYLLTSVKGTLDANSPWKWYIDGVEVASGNKLFQTCEDASNLLLGRADEYGNLVLDELCIYNRTISATEVQENFEKGLDFSSKHLAKIPKDTTQIIVTVTWQGIGSINVTVESPSKDFTEDSVSTYQKTDYSSNSGDMLNIKRLSISVTALSSEENWYISLEFDDVEDYRMSIEVQK